MASHRLDPQADVLCHPGSGRIPELLPGKELGTCTTRCILAVKVTQGPYCLCRPWDGVEELAIQDMVSSLKDHLHGQKGGQLPKGPEEDIQWAAAWPLNPSLDTQKKEGGTHFC